MLATSAVLIVACAFGVALVHDDERHGDPMVIGSIGVAPPSPRPESPSSPPPVESPVRDEATQPAVPVQQIVIENGVRVIRGLPPTGTGPTALKVLDLGPPMPTIKAEAQLIETSALGPLPRIAPDGRRPSGVYAAAPVATSGRPRLALVVGGMGLNRAATARASAELPAAVTFGFAPYGENLPAQVSLARAAGHEVVLQLPMEDFGGDGHALPHMLKAEVGGNAERLHWLMSRFTGYAGVANYLGGRLLAAEDSLKPLLREVAERGLYFVDDGSAPRSRAMALAHDLDLSAARADLIVDASTDEASIAAGLLRLETRARDQGTAIGIVTGRPATNAQIARYIADVAKRGLVVVPLSQVVEGAPGPAAAR